MARPISLRRSDPPPASVDLNKISHCLISSSFEPPLRALKQGEASLIGRDPAAQMVLQSDRISHSHARVVWGPEGVVVEDLGSKNGITVDGERVATRVLQDGEVLGIGPFNIRYRQLRGDVEELVGGSSSGAVSGLFTEGELIELGSMFQFAGLTGTLGIVDCEVPGQLTVDKGVVVKATAGALSGLDAAQQLLTTAQGRFEFLSAARVEKGDLHKPLGDLLVEIIGKSKRATRGLAMPGDRSGDLSAEVARASARLQTARALLAEANVRGEFGNLFAGILVVFFLYAMSLTILPQAVWAKTLVTMVATVGFTFGVVALIKQSPYPMRSFGLNLENWRRSLVESLLVTVPVFAILLLGRLALREGQDPSPNRPLFVFDVDARFLAYPVVVALQEFLLRGAIQTSLQRFLIGRGATLRAVLLSSLLFGMMHMHLSVAMAIATTLMSIIWGHLFARHKTLLGVWLSHLILGAVAFALWGGVVPGVWD